MLNKGVCCSRWPWSYLQLSIYLAVVIDEFRPDYARRVLRIRFASKMSMVSERALTVSFTIMHHSYS